MIRDFVESPAGAIATVFLALGLVVGGVFWAVGVFNHKYPCVRTARSTCGGGLYCISYGTTGLCQVCMPQPIYPCDVCVERTVLK